MPSTVDTVVEGIEILRLKTPEGRRIPTTLILKKCLADELLDANWEVHAQTRFQAGSLCVSELLDDQRSGISIAADWHTAGEVEPILPRFRVDRDYLYDIQLHFSDVPAGTLEMMERPASDSCESFFRNLSFPDEPPTAFDRKISIMHAVGRLEAFLQYENKS